MEKEISEIDGEKPLTGEMDEENGSAGQNRKEKDLKNPYFKIALIIGVIFVILFILFIII